MIEVQRKAIQEKHTIEEEQIIRCIGLSVVYESIIDYVEYYLNPSPEDKARFISAQTFLFPETKEQEEQTQLILMWADLKMIDIHRAIQHKIIKPAMKIRKALVQ